MKDISPDRPFIPSVAEGTGVDRPLFHPMRVLASTILMLPPIQNGHCRRPSDARKYPLRFTPSAQCQGPKEPAIVNTLEPGDEAIVCVNGYFSERMFEVASRTQSHITKVEAPLGRPVDPDDVRRAAAGKKIKIVGLAHGETSTGVVTQLDGFRKVADELGALLVVDAVASLAAVP